MTENSTNNIIQHPALREDDAPQQETPTMIHAETAPASSDAAIAAAAFDALSDTECSALILKTIQDELDADKAEDIVTINLSGKTDIADAMVVASGRSQRHVGALADHVVRRLKEVGYSGAKIEGMPACDWVLIDAQHVIVHLFRPEVREFYNIERVWSEEAHAEAGSANSNEPQ